MTPDPSAWSARLARFVLKLAGGWRIDTDPPTEPQAVLLACPHTSNVDGFLLVLIARGAGIRIRWMVKDVWTKAPLGWLTKPVGAVPVDRSQRSGVVSQMVDEFEQRDDLLLVIPPEGTRQRAEHWKSGFYEIALRADVPVVPTYLDYANRRAGFLPSVSLTGDRRADMDVFRSIYADGAAMARRPDQFGPVGLRDESSGEDAAAAEAPG